MVGKLSDLFLGPGENNRSIVATKFDVTSAQVSSELIDALTGSYGATLPFVAAWVARGRPQATAVSDIAAVSTAVKGDWWGPFWIGSTFSLALCVLQSTYRYFGGATVTLGGWFGAGMIGSIYLGGLTVFLQMFCAHVAQDPTFYGSYIQRLKLHSFAGYSLAPFTVAVVFQAVLRALGWRAQRFVGSVVVYGPAALCAAGYIRSRVPLRAVGAYAPAFDQQKAAMVFWGGFASFAVLLVLLIQAAFLGVIN